MDISVLEIAATQITASGTLPALNGSNLTALSAANITASGTLPALNGAALTALSAANITASGTLPALNGAALTALSAANITASGTLPALVGTALTALDASNASTGTLPAARIAADSIVEGKLNVSNGPTNGQVLTARDGVAGGFTWEAAAASSDTAYASSWNGVTTIAPSKNAIYDKIELLAPIAGATLTGTTQFATLSDGTIAVTAWVDQDDMSSNSATLIPTQQSVKAYVDAAAGVAAAKVIAYGYSLGNEVTF